MGWKMTLLGGLAACCGALVNADQVASSGSSYLVSRPTKLGATATSWPTEYGAVGVTTANVASDGSLAWSDTVGSGDTEIVGGNVYVVGSTRGNMTSNNANAGNFDWFILKYLPSGARSWTKQVGTPAHDEARTVVVTTEADGNDYIYVLGVTYGAMDDTLHVSNGYRQFGGRDLFLYKLTTAGAKLWSRQFGTSGDDYAYGVTIDAGQLLVSGGAPGTQFLTAFNTSGAMTDMVADGGVTILPIQMRLAEGDSTVGKYTVVLNRQPTASVTISVTHPALVAPSGQPLPQVRLSTMTLVFNASNWNLPQAVTVTAIDDAICEHTHYAAVSHAVSSSDKHFAPSTPFVLGRQLLFTIRDNDVASIALSRQHLYAVEGGARDTYSIVLTSQPWQNVLVTAMALRPLQTQLHPTTVEFNSSNWNTPQWISVTAVDDAVSENEFGGVHAGGTVTHVASSLDANYNTRQPSCYYVATCNCSGVVTRGNCSTQPTSCQAGTPALVCDVNATITGNGELVPLLSGGNATAPLNAIPMRYGAAALNPNPPTSSTTFINSALETIQVPMRLVQLLPAPLDDGWGGVWTTQAVQRINSSAINPNPLSYIVSGLNLSAVPADVAGYVYSLVAVSDGAALAALAQNQTQLVWALCLGMQRLTTQRWAFDAWPPGTADRVLDALFFIFPNLQERLLWNCGGATFTPSVGLDVTVFDNDPAVTISKMQLQVAEGGATDSYSVVLNAPPSQGQSATGSLCASPTMLPDVCVANYSASGYRAAFALSPTSTDTVTIVASSTDQVQIAPPFLVFTSANWFVPQTFTVTAVANHKDDGPLNSTITHAVFASGAGAQSFTSAAFWMASCLPSSSSPFIAPPLPYNALPEVYFAPQHSQVQVLVLNTEKAAVLASTAALSIKEIDVTVDAAAVGATSTGVCTDSLTMSSQSGTITNVLLLATNQTSLVRFQLPFLHHSAFNSVLGSATLELTQTKYAVVNTTWLNVTTATLNPTFTVRVRLVQSNWTEPSFASLPPPMLIPPVVLNITMINSVLRLDVTRLVAAVGASLPLLSFQVDVLAASATVQVHARSDPENLAPSLVLRTHFPNLLLNQPTLQSPSSSNSGAAVDGNVTSVMPDAFSWWQVTLPSVLPLGTLAIFLPLTTTSGALAVVVSTAPLPADWTLATGPSNGVLVHNITIRRPVLVWPIPGAGQYIRLYAQPDLQILLREVQLYPRSVNVTTTDDGYSVRATNWVSEAKVNPNYDTRQVWTLASGANVRSDNVALGIPSTLSTTATTPITTLSTTFETNPYWEMDLGTVQSIGAVSLRLARSLAEATLCKSPTMPTAPNTISSFTSARLRLSSSPMTATVNATAEKSWTSSLSACFDLTLSWPMFASGRYLRLDMVGSGALHMTTVNVQRWAAQFSQYALVELRGSGVLPLALPGLRFLGDNESELPIQVFGASSSASGGCFLVGAAPSVREWVVVDFGAVRTLKNVVLSLSVASCTGSVEAPSAISVSVYGDPALTYTPPLISNDACSCTSDAWGRSSTVLPASCNGVCSGIQCTTATCSNADGTLVRQGTTLYWSAFRDLVVLAPTASLPTTLLPFTSGAYSLFLLRDEPLWLLQLSATAPDANVSATNVVFTTAPTFPTTFAALTSSSSLVVSSVFGRSTWFGISYFNTRDGTFTLEFWAAFPSTVRAGSLAAYASSARATFTVGLFANQTLYFSLSDQGITSTVVGPVALSSPGVTPTTWHHIVAVYDWKQQIQTLSVNAWTPASGATSMFLGQVTRSDTIAVAANGQLTFSGSLWLANVAFYQRALSAFEILEHFYQPTPTKSYAMLNFRLATNPMTSVDVNLVSELSCYRWGLCYASVLPPTLRFTPTNWNETQYVFVHATDDLIAEGLHPDVVTYEILAAATRATSMTVLTPAYATTCASSLDTFFRNYILNATEPQALPLPSAVAASFGSLQTSWAVQNVSTTIVPVLGYSNVSVSPLQLTIADINVARVEISAYYLMLYEAGLGDIFQVVLTAEPKNDVYVQLNASTDCYRSCGVATAANPCPVPSTTLGNESRLCNCTVSPLRLHFTPSTWNLPQAVTVTPTDDRLDEADVHYTKIVVTTTSADLDYDQMFLESIRVAVVDNDVSNIVLSTKSIALSEDDTSTAAEYTMVLATEPWSEVNITISNEATGGCYRTCGYPIDPASCGLPRPVATNSIEIKSSSVREIQSVTAAMTTTNGIQIVTTTTTHIDPVVIVRLTGGFALQTYELSITFPLGTTASSTLPYGATFQVSTTTSVTPPLDGFVSASALQSAINGLQPGYVVTRTTTSASSGAPMLVWRIVYGAASPSAPILVLNFPTSFLGTGVLRAIVPTAVAPTGVVGWSYGPTPGPVTVAYGASAAQMTTYLESIPGINTVTVQRAVVDFGFEYTITFTSVPIYYATVSVDTRQLVLSASATSSVVVSSSVTRSPNQIGGFFVLSYPVNATYTGVSTPLRYNASANEVMASLAGIPTLGPVSVQQRQLTPELTFTWTIEFTGNVGPVKNLTAQSVNLTGLASAVILSFVQQGEMLGGGFALRIGGAFINQYATGEVYNLSVPALTTPYLPFNASAAAVQSALHALPLLLPLVGVQVNRIDAFCDTFGRCRQYSWQITFAQTPGNVPEMAVLNNITGTGASVVASTVANGTYLNGMFTISLALNATGTVYTGTTWLLPVNVTADGVKEALEAFPFVTSNRLEDSAYDPTNALAVPRATKGVRVTRTGPYLDGGYKWLLDWSLNDWLVFTNVNVTVNTTLISQDLVPVTVATQYTSSGPRCAVYPKTVFQVDPTDVFGLRGTCVYPLLVSVNPERYLCNMTVTTPRKIFDASNWYIPQTIDVVSVHDRLDESSTATNVTISTLTHEAYTLDFIYADVNVPTVAVNVTDVDRARVVVSKSLLVAAENGSITDTYTLVLTTEPRASVLIVVYPYIVWTDCYRFGFCNVTLDTTEVEFTVQNWYIPQTVSMRATPDRLDEADTHFGGISHGVFSDDVKYNGTAVANITVQIYDADTSAVIVTKTTLAISEAGASDVYGVVLATEPWAKVTITALSNGTDNLGNQVLVSAPLVFTWLNWNVTQMITVSPIHDNRVDPAPHTALLRHTITTNDLIYRNRTVANVTTTITDIDVAGVELSSTAIFGAEGSTTPIVYGVRLTSKPWFPVLLTFNGSHSGCAFGICNITVVTPSIAFDGSTWSSWQNVSVVVTDDFFDEGGLHSANISHTLTSLDSVYAAVRPPLLTVWITDNDVSGLVLSSTRNLTVAQGSFNATVSLQLSSAPWSNVTVLLQIPAETFLPRGSFTGATVSEPLIFASNFRSQTIAALSFSLANWNVSQIVVLTALQTGSPKPLTMYTSLVSLATSLDRRYNASVPAPLYITVLGKEDVPPPVPLAATFDATGVKIFVTFDSSVYQNATMTVDLSQPMTNIAGRYVLPSRPFGCDLIWNLTVDTSYSLGAGANCLWLNLTTLQMVLGAGASIAPGNVLQLNGCGSQYVSTAGVCSSPFVLKSRDFNVLFTTASIAVALGPVVVPQIVLVGPKSIGPCGVLSLDATGSSGGANRPFTVQWFAMLTSALDPAISSDNVSAVHQQTQQIYANIASYCTTNATLLTNPFGSVADLNAMCRLRALALASASLTWQVNRSLLLSGRNYVVGVRLTNFFQQAGLASQVVATLSDPVPVVSIVGPSVMSVQRTQAISIQAAIAPTTSGCMAATSAVNYVWTATAVDASTNATVPVRLANTAVDPRYFVLSPNALSTNLNYTLRITAFYASAPAVTSADVVVISVLASPLVAQFAGGSHVVGALDPITLNASTSYDPDQADRVLQYAWSCLDVTPVLNTTTNMTSSSGGVCWNPMTDAAISFVGVNGPVVTLPPGSFAAPKILRFTVVVTLACSASVACGSRSATASTDITTVSGRIPVVRISASSTLVNPTSKVVLTPNISSLYPYTTLWRQDVGDLNLASGGLLFPLNATQNAIAPSVLTPGKTYVFRLTALDSTGSAGFGTISITVNSPPTPGSMSILPAQGMAISDLFTVTCGDWTDANLPLTYAFDLVVNGSRVPLASGLTLPSTQVRLYLSDGTESNATVTVIGRVTDSLGATSTISATALVLQPKATNTTSFWSTISNGTLSDAMQGGNFNDALNVLVSTAAVLKTQQVSVGACNATSCGAHGYSGADCSIADAALNTLAMQMLGSLQSVGTSVQPTATTLTQSALALSSIVSLNSQATSVDASNVKQAAAVLTSITSSAITLKDPSSFVSSSGPSVLSATVLLAQNTNNTDVRNATYTQLLESLFTVVAISSAGLLLGQAPVALTSPSAATYSVLGNLLPLPLGARTTTVALTPVTANCFLDTYFLDVVAWTTPVHARSLPTATPALLPSVDIGVHTLTAYAAAQFQGTLTSGVGKPLSMSTLDQTDACVLYQQNLLNTDIKLPLVNVSFAHDALTTGPRFETACLSWNASIDAYDASLCTKVQSLSSATTTTCSCTRLGSLEVVVVMQEVLNFEPLNPTVYRDDPTSFVPGVSLALLLAMYALGLRWGVKRDASDKEALRLQRLGKLSKATWNDLLRAENAKSVDDIAPTHREFAPVTDASTTTHAFTATWHPTTAPVALDPVVSEEAVVDAEAAALASIAVITEGTSIRLLMPAQHVLIRRALQVLNLFLLLVAAVFLAIGVDFYAFLGNTTANPVVAVFGPPVGLGLLGFGIALVVVAAAGLLAAVRNTSARARMLYIVLLLLVLVAETVLLAIAYKHLEDITDFPRSTLSFLKTQWAALSDELRTSLQNDLGCCGFTAIDDAPALPCPDAALLSPTTVCFDVLTASAVTLFGNLFSALVIVLGVQVAALGLANVLVRWEAIRIETMANGTLLVERLTDASSVGLLGVASKATLLDVVLRCSLPVCSHLSVCAMVFGVVAGLDMLLQWDLFALASITIFVRQELGIPITVLAALYIVLHVYGAPAIAHLHRRRMKRYVACHVVLLVVGVALVIVLATVSDNLGAYSNLQSILQTRYLGLPAQSKLELETNLGCCGFNATSQGACVTPTTAPLCAEPLTFAIRQFATVMQARLSSYLVSQFCLVFLTGLFLTMQADAPVNVAASPSTSSANEFTDAANLLLQRICTQFVLFASLVVAFCGAILVGVGVDVLLETNIVAIAAVLTAFSYYIGTYVCLLGLLLCAGSGLGLYAGLSHARRWLWRFGALLLSACVACLALFATAYRVQNPVAAGNVNATMYRTWQSFVPATRKLIQDAYSCCGYTKLGASTFSLPYTVSEWHTDPVTGGTTTTTTTSCPGSATDGCGPHMLQTLQNTARAGVSGTVFLATVLFLLFVATTVLYYRQGRKRAVTWRVLALQFVFLVVATGVGLALLGLALLGIDVAAGTTVFSSSVVQVLFGARIGGALVASVTIGLALTSYGVYGAINKTLHIFVVYLGLTLALGTVAWSCTGVVATWTVNAQWQNTLDAYLDTIWSSLSPDDWLFLGSSRNCCGYHDPVLLPSGKLQFDRAISSGTNLACPPLAITGCRTPLLLDASSLLNQLYKLLAAYATLQTLLWLVGAALLHGLVLLHPGTWVALRKKMRLWVAKYKDDVTTTHLVVSLYYAYDAKFTRGQRLTCVLCAVAAVAVVDAAVSSRLGCTRNGPVQCESFTGGELMGYGLLYSVVSLSVQLCFAALFRHVKHRQDDDDGAKVAERRRKEKVYLREVLHHSIQAIAAKLGQFAMATSEERFYRYKVNILTLRETNALDWSSWLAGHVTRMTLVLSWLRVLLAVAIGVYMGLSQLGLGFFIYNVSVPGTLGFAAVPATLVATTLVVALSGLLKRRKRFTRHAYVMYLVAAGASLLLIGFLATVIFMIVQAMEEPTEPPNWTQRNANFSVVASIKSTWLNDTIGYNRRIWQAQLRCCGLPEFPLRPCPMGTTELQNVTAQRVDGSTVVKTVTIVHDLGGCLNPILAQIQGVAQTIIGLLIALAVLELFYAACAYFLARDLVISWDSQLRRASMQPKLESNAAPLLHDEAPASKTAPPQRGRMLSNLVQTSINNVSKSVAQLLSKTNASPATRPKPSSAARLALLKLQLRLRYPAWIPRLIFGLALLFVGGAFAGTILLCLALANDGAWLWLGAALISLFLHLVVVEPSVLFAYVVSQTLSTWWKSSWVAVLIGVGRAILHLDDATGSDAQTAALLDPFTRIRHNAAVVIQRRWVAKLCRMRYLIILRVARENEHKSFTREETEAFAMLFRDADYAKTGLVSYKVVSHAVHALGVQVPAAVVKEYLVSLDPGFVELIDIDYFLFAMSCIRGYHQAQQEAHATEDVIVIPHASSPEAKFQVKRQNILRELKDKRESVSKHLMTKVGKLAAQLHKHGESPKEDQDPKPSGAYILLSSKKGTRPTSASPRGPAPATAAAPEAVQERSAEAVVARPDTRGQLSVRATKDIEKAMKALKNKQDGKKHRK
ncbi:hypothetical protein SDRG_13627 [Saprolegnia diclina VS20]|uniref:PKD/REJ-like domain-containing protein n=1 Tax=Saprolegnia diclina (strain VS20) TaxID=1156394 RepID=T0PSS4_SAPDV|nr:hypothetical protein SDRG_13627 [Saprolegnia diclina VS20]EQC28549.1 hypothetical protein SDRG_13627 [Saprolegnia diclina VS20]|eukprot:XP_008617946.1 hypothetical protein SDRG_13627 [Saprolegnia diclina VS20]